MESDIAAIATRLSERVTEIGAAISTTVEDNIAELPRDERMIELMHRGIRDHLQTILQALLHSVGVEKVKAPPAALEYARRLAQQDVSPHAMMRAHRLGQRRMTELVFAELQASGLEPAARVGVIQVITKALLKYVDSVELQALAAYQGERQLLLESRSTARETQVRDVLEDDTPVDADAASTAIGYPLGWQHLALIVWYPDGDTVGDEFTRLQRFIRDLANTVDTSASPLLAAAEPASAWVWLPYRSPPGDAVAKIRQFVRSRPDAPNVAIGAVGSGVKGFRRSHRQAQRAQAAGRARSRHETVLVAATDPGIITPALLGAGIDEIREWVADILGPLASDTDDDAGLRNTLREFLRSGSGYDAHTEELSAAPSIVKSGVERAVARRGRPIDDRVDVELALLACEWYGAAVLLRG
ncbi:PucR family transcriptional regulator [Mycobacterium heidelbergense]|uniref:PucR family transcriptional regulator n=1 Tax=Mycobacterium heidelbergense TaxID=53376 RepID=UPI003CF44563